MRQFLAGLFLVTAAGLLIYLKSPVSYYMKPKQERLFMLWSADLEQMNKNQQFQKVFSNIAKVEVHFTDPQVAEEFSDFKTPFKSRPENTYLLKISVTRWIERSEYGFVIQHELFDNTEDKLYELGRTYRVGLIF